MIYILYSADYEIFHGKNFFSEKDILIKPTDSLLKTCDSIDVPITLFCDTECIERYNTLKINDFPDIAETQLQNAIRNGHDVQAHLHPHWENAIINDNSWKWEKSNYSLGNSPEEEVFNNAKILLEKASSYLTNLLRPIDSSYNCIAFRAGGWSLQPNERQIIKALEECGYYIDSSIAKNFKFKNEIVDIDFSNTPNDLNFYISSKTGIASNADSGIFEIPIPSHSTRNIKFNIIELTNMLSNKIFKYNLIGHPRLPKGTTLPIAHKATTLPIRNSMPRTIPFKILNFTKKIFSIAEPKISKLELAGQSPQNLMKITKSFLKKRNLNKDVFFSFSSHPKFLYQEDYGTLKRYHEMIIKEYGNDIQAITFQNAFKKIK
tara:strand:+ start:1540 stop:2670 length:1131 start_codon:yes stop_codon:yes gene_type:complete